MDFGAGTLESSLGEESFLTQAVNLDTMFSTYLTTPAEGSQGPGCDDGLYYQQPLEYSACSGGLPTAGGLYYVGQESCGAPEDEGTNNHSYRRTPIAEWQGEDCLSWALSLCTERGLDASSAHNLWGLRKATGAALLRSSPEDLAALVGSQLGRFLFQELRAMINKGAGKQWHSPAPFCDTAHHDVSLDTVSCDPREGLGATPPPFGGYDDTSSSSSFGGYSDEDLADLFRRVPQEVWDLLPDSLQDFSMQDQPLQIKYEEPLAEASYPLPTALGHLGGSSPPVGFGSPVPGHLSGTPNDVFKKIPTNTRRKERGPKSWEFLVRLLADKRTNPSVIRWEDEATATFRLTQPKIIAQMWGGRADKPSLSYVNFARGLRYHYNTGALEPVSERQLVYRCGPKALKYLQELKSELP
ncbi:uncharacterized protein LOC135199360 [Macrobrachium nipponense]|uniref:uncharacterized protein LOC135199360 n=1 Tax=Macrobrachium nipponense TaxID=159736 RepID=UPI0030C8C358